MALKLPTYLFVDENNSLYGSNSGQHSILKWMINQSEVVTGETRRLTFPTGIIVDNFESIYVADRSNHRIVRWTRGAINATRILGTNQHGNQSNQFHYPTHLCFDKYSNLYVVDQFNHRIQLFYLDFN